MSTVGERDGTAQADRPLRALEPGWFDVDERDLPTLIALGERLAANLVFRDLDDRTTGTWEPLFAADELAVMADIASVDVARLERAFRRLGASADLAGQGRFVLVLARQIDRWLHRLGSVEHESAAVLGERIVRIVEGRLAADLRGVLMLLDELGAGARTASDRRGFGRIWGLDPKADVAVGNARAFRPDAIADGGGGNVDERRTRWLAARFAGFLDTVVQLQDVVAERFESSLESGRHEPAFGLYVAFLRLFGRAQARLNEFPRRRLAFYHDRVLAVPTRPAAADHVHLVLEPVAGVGAVDVPAGATFVAGRDADGEDVRFRADRGLALTATRVATLHTVTRARDRLVSPETELGLVVRSETSTFPDREEEGARPLFGVGGRGGCAGAEPARFGFYLACAALDLAEGARTIVADIVMTPAPGEAPPTLERVLDSLRESTGETAFFATLGGVIGRELLGGGGWLSPVDRLLLLRVVGERLCPGPPERHLAGAFEVVRDYLERDRLALFHELLRDAFVLRFSAPDGWRESEDFHFEPIESGGGGHALGLRLVFRPGVGAEPIVPLSAAVHGTAFATTLPVIGLRLNPASPVHVRSLFDHVAVDRVELRVAARGVTALDLWNQLGRIDPSAPFRPFGPLPNRDSRLVIGCPEAAHKRLVSFRLTLDWGGLPPGEGGFVRHYRGYENRYDVDTLRVRTAVLRHGEWLEAGGAGQRLFEREGGGGRLAARRRLPVDVTRFGPREAVRDEAAREYSTRSRDGFLRLSLEPTPHAFGHGEYPRLLTTTLSANARRRKPAALPNEPYAPQVNRVSVDYVATAVVHADPGGNARAGASAVDVARVDRLLHEHPFGWSVAWSALGREGCPLLPRHPMDGMLLVGLAGARPAGALTLLFHLGEDAGETFDAASTELAWFYLASNRWRALSPERLLSDTTCGFFRSGIVTLDVPTDIDRDNTLLPGDRWWLAVGANGALGDFPSLRSVTTSALRATRIASSDTVRHAAADAEPGWPGGRGAIWQSDVAGVGRVRQRGAAFGGCPAETPRARETRIAERLRHKRRALTPWDHERLLLERFPDVAKVKCFPNAKTGDRRRVPGHVLVAVVPDITRRPWSGSSPPRFDALELGEMRDFLRESTSPFAALEVRNPDLEQVQVHCTVRLEDGIAGGETLRRIDRLISDFISPWTSGGYDATFGWRIQRKDIEAALLALPPVRLVTAFSMLRLTRDALGCHRLYDTAASGSDSAEAILSGDEIASKWSREELRPSVPWSLAVSSRRHHVELVRASEEMPAQPAGVGRLEIGSTLVLNGRSRS